MCRIGALVITAMSVSCRELTYFTDATFCSCGGTIFSRLRAVLASHLFFYGVKVGLSSVAPCGCMFGGNGACVVNECNLYGVYLARGDRCPCAAHCVECVCIFYCVIISFVEGCAPDSDDLFVTYATLYFLYFCCERVELGDVARLSTILSYMGVRNFVVFVFPYISIWVFRVCACNCTWIVCRNKAGDRGCSW